MGQRTQLVLDVGGVLLRDLRPVFWERVAVRWGVRNLEQEFLSDFKAEFWSGRSAVDDLYAWIDARVGVSDGVSLRQEVDFALGPLPAVERLAAWSEVFALHLLSNHRTVWVTEKLRDYLGYFTTMTISDDAGCCKPDRAIFDLVAAKLAPGARVVYVDDHEKNLSVAAECGWATIWADAEGRWIGEINRVASDPRRPRAPAGRRLG